MLYYTNLLQAGLKFSGQQLIANSSLLIAMLTVLTALYSGFAMAIGSYGYHVDGQYQLLSTAVLAGSDGVLGRDYVLYLGILPGKILSLFIWMEAGWFVIFCSFLSVLGWMIMTRLITAVWNVPPQRIWFVTLVSFAAFIFVNAFYITEQRLLIPDNSALSYRFVFAVCLFLGLSLLLARARLPRLSIALGIALMPLISFDYGLPLGVSAGIYIAIKNWSRPMEIVRIGLMAIGMFLAMVAFFTQFHLIDFVERYRGVSDGQYWYFQSYTNKIYDFETFLNGIRQYIVKKPEYWLLIFATLATTRRLIFVNIAIALFAAAVLLETVGHRSDRYYYPFYNVNILIFIVVSVNFIADRLVRLGGNKLPLADIYQLVLAVLVVGGVMTATSERFDKQVEHLKSAYRTYSGFISPEMHAYFSQHEEVPMIIGDYYSPVTHVYNANVHTSSALALHALGEKNKRDWQRILSGNQDIVVLTTSPDYSHWHLWSIMQQTWFYDTVVTHYRPVMSDAQHVVWEGRHEAAVWADTAHTCTVIPGDSTVQMEVEFDLPDTEKIYKVTIPVTYTGDHSLWRLRWRNGTMLRGKSWRDFGAPARSDSISFIIPGGRSELNIRAVRGRGGQARIDKCQISTISDIDPAMLFPAQILANMLLSMGKVFGEYSEYTTPLDFTDSNWTNGVLTINQSAVLLVSAADLLAPYYEQGMLVELSTGEVRGIEYVRRSPKYIEIWMDGEKLEPSLHGSPAKFRLARP
ncbi:hypothetical protein [Parvularcula sp. IMCC14364]|uniref:hypothetical protein n=1 Tax=Parvularcula sp. IMCC14364 TaxID=3067902 RepID=UPI0027421380|nr:hypothetical protein [Parvularcula sp. IMCC14364]